MTPINEMFEQIPMQRQSVKYCTLVEGIVQWFCLVISKSLAVIYNIVCCSIATCCCLLQSEESIYVMSIYAGYIYWHVEVRYSSIIWSDGAHAVPTCDETDLWLVASNGIVVVV